LKRTTNKEKKANICPTWPQKHGTGTIEQLSGRVGILLIYFRKQLNGNIVFLFPMFGVMYTS
jgi:hypothetical protein